MQGVFLLFAFCFFASCDNKWDKNGDLDGMWQMTEWRNTETQRVVATQEDGFYYSIQQQLIKFQTTDRNSHYLAYFTHTGDSLFIASPTEWPSNTVRPMTELEKYGVPADGRFHIDVLNNKHMVLSTETQTLTFRKY